MTISCYASLVALLQRSQQEHDQANHGDIFTLHAFEKLKHFHVHFSKYVGRMAGVNLNTLAGMNQIWPTVVDTALICLSAANCLKIKLDELVPPEVGDELTSTQTAQHLFTQLAVATGHIAKAIDGHDHMESVNVRTQCQPALVQIMCAVLVHARNTDTDLVAAVEARRQEIRRKKLY